MAADSEAAAAERIVNDRCAQCTNRCKIRLAVDGNGIVQTARRRIPSHNGMKLVECPNLAKLESLSIEAALEKAHTRTMPKVVLSGH